MKYITKKSNIFVLILSSLLFCLLAGCSNLNTNDSKSSSLTKDSKQIVVTGRIRSENQTNQISQTNNTPRSATTSYTLTDSHKMNISASRSLEGMAAGYVEGTVTGNTYTIILDATGTWDLYLSISAPNTEGEESSFITLHKELVVEDSDTELSAPDFVITSDYNNLHNGGLNLTIIDESEKLYSISYSATLYGVVPANQNSFENVATKQFVDHIVTLNLDNIVPNDYRMTFNFKDSAGNILYSCFESIPVMAGFITDTWVGEDAHLKKNEQTGKTEFVITDELIENYGADVVPNTNYLLYNYTNSNAQYYVSDSLDTIGTQSVAVSNYKNNQYAFDRDGNIYFFTESNSVSTVKKGDETYTLPTDSIFPDRIIIDRKNNIFYGCLINEMTLDLYRFDYFISGPDERRNEYTAINSFSFPSESFGYSFMHNSEMLLIYDSILYGFNTDEKILYKVDLNKTFTSAEKLDLSLDDFDIDSTTLESCEYTDIIYQDGFIFILFRNVREDSSYGVDFYSRGGVICFNTFTKSVERVIGWTENPLSNDAYSYLTYSGLVKNTTDDYYVLAKVSDIVDKNEGSSLFNIYCPESDDEGFYGPEKFIALKPKKLVIADNGMAYYTDDNDAYRVKNLNRVVIVDLETFALESAVIDESIKFASETTNGSGYLAGNGCMYSSISSDTTLYKSTDKTEMTEDEINSIVNEIRSSSFPDEGMFPDGEIGGGIPAIPFDTTNLEF